MTYRHVEKSCIADYIAIYHLIVLQLRFFFLTFRRSSWWEKTLSVMSLRVVHFVVFFFVCLYYGRVVELKTSRASQASG